MSGLLIGMLGGGISGLATTLGGLPILFRSMRIINLLKNINMDFVTGVMLSASAFSLILPAFKGSSQYGFLLLTLFGGVFFIYGVSKILESLSYKNESINKNRQAYLFIVAMMAHNLPEGLASGASLTMSDPHQSYSLLSAITIQNLPEGLTTALSFLSLGVNPWMAFIGNMLTGMVEFIGGMLGGYASYEVKSLLPFFLSFAGGAMMSITILEVLKGIHESSFKYFIRPSFLSGAILMMALTNI